MTQVNHNLGTNSLDSCTKQPKNLDTTWVIYRLVHYSKQITDFHDLKEKCFSLPVLYKEK